MNWVPPCPLCGKKPSERWGRKKWIYRHDCDRRPAGPFRGTIEEWRLDIQRVKDFMVASKLPVMLDSADLSTLAPGEVYLLTEPTPVAAPTDPVPTDETVLTAEAINKVFEDELTKVVNVQAGTPIKEAVEVAQQEDATTLEEAIDLIDALKETYNAASDAPNENMRRYPRSVWDKAQRDARVKMEIAKKAGVPVMDTVKGAGVPLGKLRNVGTKSSPVTTVGNEPVFSKSLEPVVGRTWAEGYSSTLKPKKDDQPIPMCPFCQLVPITKETEKGLRIFHKCQYLCGDIDKPIITEPTTWRNFIKSLWYPTQSITAAQIKLVPQLVRYVQEHTALFDLAPWADVEDYLTRQFEQDPFNQPFIGSPRISACPDCGQLPFWRYGRDKERLLFHYCEETEEKVIDFTKQEWEGRVALGPTVANDEKPWIYRLRRIK